MGDAAHVFRRKGIALNTCIRKRAEKNLNQAKKEKVINVITEMNEIENWKGKNKVNWNRWAKQSSIKETKFMV